MKTQYYTATSLDGYIATEANSLDWLFTLEDLGESTYPAFMAEVGAIAMGSSTYEWLLKNEVKPGTPDEKPWFYTIPTWIFSSRPQTILPNANIHFVKGDVRPIHAKMKEAAESKNIWITGGGDLAGQFFDAGLLDELIVQIGSVTLGGGKPLFPRRAISPTLSLTSAQKLGKGMVELRYEVNKRE